MEFQTSTPPPIPTPPGATPPVVPPGKYIYWSPAWWTIRGSGVHVADMSGILGLTATGRIECILDGGKVLFSAPVALTRRLFESSMSHLRIVVGPRQYTLRFHKGELGSASMTPAIGMIEGQLHSDIYKTWQQTFTQYEAAPPDNLPIIAAAKNKEFKRKADHYANSWGTFILVIMFVGGAGGLIAAKAHDAQAVMDSFKFLVIPAVFIVGFYIFQKVKVLPVTIDPTTLPSDTYPPGTPPTAGFGMTVPKGVLLGLSTPFLIFGAIFVIALVAAIVNAIITGFTN